MVMRQLKDEHNAIEKEKEKHLNMRDECQRKLNTDLKVALEICPQRIEVGRPVKEIDDQMTALKRKIEVQSNGQSIQSILKEYRSIKSNYDSVCKLINKVSDICEALKQCADQLQESWRKYLR